jgi:hypothetical protein
MWLMLVLLGADVDTAVGVGMPTPECYPAFSTHVAVNVPIADEGIKEGMDGWVSGRRNEEMNLSKAREEKSTKRMN